MKNIFKLCLGVCLLSGLVSCEDSEALIDEVVENVDTERGAIVRTIEAPIEFATISNEDNNVLDLTIEVQQGDGSFIPDFTEVRAYVALFQDQDVTEPLVDGAGNDIGEILYTSLAEANFTIESNGLPRGSISIPTQGIVDALPADAVYTTPSFIALRLELEMADGTIWTNTDVGATISGGIYFNSPFFYRIILIPN